MSSTRFEVIGLSGIGEVADGDDIGQLIFEASRGDGGLRDGDIAVVTSKIVSKAEGRAVELATVEPSEFAREWAEAWNKDAAVVELVLRESRRIVRQVGAHLITETRHGFICANAGVDQSNAGAKGRALLLPVDPDASARRIRASLANHGADLAVIITDTFGRPWRIGQTDIAIGIAGIKPITSYLGQEDPHGHRFHVQALCTVDELAGAGELVKGNLSRIPVAIIRGFDWVHDEEASIKAVIRPSERDLFR